MPWHARERVEQTRVDGWVRSVAGKERRRVLRCAAGLVGAGPRPAPGSVSDRRSSLCAKAHLCWVGCSRVLLRPNLGHLGLEDNVCSKGQDAAGALMLVQQSEGGAAGGVSSSARQVGAAISVLNLGGWPPQAAPL